MRVLLSTHRSRENVEPMVAAKLVAAQFDRPAATAQGCVAPVATGVMPTGVWR